MTKLCAFLFVALASCGTDAPPPSCQEALTHYYNAGCHYIDLSTSMPIPLNTEIGNCFTAVSSGAPQRCLDKLNDWLVCNDEVMGPVTGDAACDCSQSLMAAVSCQ